MNIKPRKANELSFCDEILHEFASLEGKCITVEGDVLLNIAIMKGGLELLSSVAYGKMPENAVQMKTKEETRKGKWNVT